MSIYKELDYNTEISDIKELQFSVSSPEEIEGNPWFMLHNINHMIII